MSSCNWNWLDSLCVCVCLFRQIYVRITATHARTLANQLQLSVLFRDRLRLHQTSNDILYSHKQTIARICSIIGNTHLNKPKRSTTDLVYCAYSDGVGWILEMAKEVSHAAKSVLAWIHFGITTLVLFISLSLFLAMLIVWLLRAFPLVN